MSLCLTCLELCGFVWHRSGRSERPVGLLFPLSFVWFFPLTNYSRALVHYNYRCLCISLYNKQTNKKKNTHTHTKKKKKKREREREKSETRGNVRVLNWDGLRRYVFCVPLQPGGRLGIWHNSITACWGFPTFRTRWDKRQITLALNQGCARWWGFLAMSTLGDLKLYTRDISSEERRLPDPLRMRVPFRIFARLLQTV